MPTLNQVFVADGIAEAVDFQLQPGLRNHTDGFHCPEEEVNCPTTTYILCAFAALPTRPEQIAFLKCMDEAKDGVAPATKTEGCAKLSSLDFSDISTCFSDGRGTELMQAAADWIFVNYPVGGPELYAPHVKIGGKTLTTDPSHASTYDEVIAAVCATGIEAGACSGVPVVV